MISPVSNTTDLGVPIMLDINYLYNGPVTHPSQIKHRQRMTEAVYQDKRHEKWQAFTWLFVSIAHIFIVMMTFSISHELSHELAQSPLAAFALAFWLCCDVVYIFCFPKLHNNIQYELDRLEGKISS